MASTPEPINPSQHHGEHGNPDVIERTRRVLKDTQHERLGESVLDLGLVGGIDADADRVAVTLLDTGEGLHGVHRLWTIVRNALGNGLPDVERVEVWIDWETGWTVEQASPRIQSSRDWCGNGRVA